MNDAARGCASEWIRFGATTGTVIPRVTHTEFETTDRIYILFHTEQSRREACSATTSNRLQQFDAASQDPDIEE